MKVNCITIISLLCITLFTTTLQAVWLNDVPSEITQPDGKIVKIFSSGDEFHHWGHNEEGYIIQLDQKTGFHCWARLEDDELVSTGYPIHLYDPKSLGLVPNDNISEEAYAIKRARWTAITKESRAGLTREAPTTGNLINLVIFIKFADQGGFTQNYSFYENRFNQTGASISSLRQYYADASYGSLTVNSPLFPPANGTAVAYYTAPYNYDYIRTLPWDLPSIIIWTNMLRAAVSSVSTQVAAQYTGAQLDANNDGDIDNVFFIIKGNADPNSEYLWSHRFVLYYGSPDVSINGKWAYDYVAVMEDHATMSGGAYGVGVLAHEYGHTLGAPDFYTYSAITPTGTWDLMANTANPPQSHTAYTSYRYYGWIAPQLVVKSGTYTLAPFPANQTGSTLKIPSPNSSGQYFMVENRQKTSSLTDSTIPASGLLISRCAPQIDGNGADSSTRTYELYYYRPNGTISSNGSITTAHYGVSGRTTINDTTNPTSFIYTESGSTINNSSRAGGLDISNISLNTTTNVVTLTINMRNEPTNVASSVSGNTVTITWNAPTLWGTPQGYNIYRNNVKLNASPLAASPRTYTDSSPVDGSNVYTVTTVYNGNNGLNQPASGYMIGESAPSASTSQNVQLWPVPQNLQATNNTTHVTLTWTAVTAPGGVTLQGYKVYRNGTAVSGTITPTTYDDNTISFNNAYTYHVTAVFNAGESSASSVAQVTTTAPSPPQDLQATNNISHVSLSWSAVSDSGLQGYNVYRNGTAVSGTIALTTYDDATISPNITYTYHVTAVFSVGETAPSSSVEIFTAVPNPPQSLVATPQNGYVQLAWQPPAENTLPITLQGYKVYRDDTAISSIISATTFENIGTIAGTEYAYTVISVYEAHESAPTAVATATSLPPNPPQELAVTNTVNTITFAWQPPTQNPNSVNFTVYVISRDTDASWLSVGSDVLSHDDDTATYGTEYTYSVTAVYTNGSSEPSGSITATAYHENTWLPPRNLTAVPGYTVISLQWEAPTAAVESATLTGYIVYRDDEAYSELLQILEFADSDVEPEQTYAYFVKAVYTSPVGESVATGTVSSALLIFNFPPPEDLTATPDYEQIMLNWTAPELTSSEIVLAGYDVYRNDVLISQLLEGTAYIDEDVTSPAQYEYFVKAVYTTPEGISVASNTQIAALLIYAFNPPQNLTATPTYTQIELSWQAPEYDTDNGELAGYNVYRNSELISELLEDTQYTDTSSTAGERTYYVTALYTLPFASMSAPSNTATTALMVFTFNPPQNLIATPSYTQITLNWQAPQYEDVAFQLVGYTLYRNNQYIPQVITTTQYIDTVIAADTQYSYYVKAVYLLPVTGTSEASNTATASLLPPPVFNPPTNLAAEPDDGVIDLAWSAPAVEEHSATLAGYIVYRDNQAITAVITTTEYSDTNVVNGTTYTYYVVATYTDPQGTSEPTDAVQATPGSNSNADDTEGLQLTTLHGNYPNPFNPTTIISFYLQKEDTVTIEIFNLKGQNIRTLVHGHFAQGLHSVNFNADDISSGIYFYSMRTSDYHAIRKMILLK